MKKEPFLILCPHCNCYVIILEINCAIFRHGILKSNFQQISPHLSKDECGELILKDLIYGCGKPFRIIKNNEEYIGEICDYI
jgi:hypothetical protein